LSEKKKLMITLTRLTPTVLLRYALLVYPQFEQLDAFGPMEVLHSLAKITSLSNPRVAQTIVTDAHLLHLGRRH
jgi:hypothetical protein